MTIKAALSIIIGCLLIGKYFKHNFYLTELVEHQFAVENFGQKWEYGSVKSKTPYRAGTGQEIDAQMEVKIGLRSVNITLKGN